jgi:hypothetical protein
MSKGHTLLNRTVGLWMVLVLAGHSIVQAQTTEGRQDGGIGAPQEAFAAQKRPIAIPDILDWMRINAPSLSHDGAWFAYRLTPTEGNSELVVRRIADETEHRFPVGEAAGGGFGGGSSVVFSDDSGWLAFTIYPTVEEAKQARTQRRPARNKVGLLKVASGEMTEIEDVRTFAFAGERGGWIALHRYPPSQGGAAAGGSGAPGGGSRGGEEGSAGNDRARGADLILRELSTGTQLNLGNVLRRLRALAGLGSGR